jgi:hypothetical protein
MLMGVNVINMKCIDLLNSRNQWIRQVSLMRVSNAKKRTYTTFCLFPIRRKIHLLAKKRKCEPRPSQNRVWFSFVRSVCNIIFSNALLQGHFSLKKHGMTGQIHHPNPIKPFQCRNLIGGVLQR